MWLQFQTLLALLDIQVDTGWGKNKEDTLPVGLGKMFKEKGKMGPASQGSCQ